MMHIDVPIRCRGKLATELTEFEQDSQLRRLTRESGRREGNHGGYIVRSRQRGMPHSSGGQVSPLRVGGIHYPLPGSLDTGRTTSDLAGYNASPAESNMDLEAAEMTLWKAVKDTQQARMRCRSGSAACCVSGALFPGTFYTSLASVSISSHIVGDAASKRRHLHQPQSMRCTVDAAVRRTSWDEHRLPLRLDANARRPAWDLQWADALNVPHHSRYTANLPKFVPICAHLCPECELPTFRPNQRKLMSKGAHFGFKMTHRRRPWPMWSASALSDLLPRLQSMQSKSSRPQRDNDGNDFTISCTAKSFAWFLCQPLASTGREPRQGWIL